MQSDAHNFYSRYTVRGVHEGQMVFGCFTRGVPSPGLTDLSPYFL